MSNEAEVIARVTGSVSATVRTERRSADGSLTVETEVSYARCAWFALCTNPAAGTVRHPILGDVPTCRRCADKHELELVAR